MNKIQEFFAKLFLGSEFIKQAQLRRQLPFVPDWLYGQPIWKSWSTDRAIKDGLKVSVWVYRCINILARTAASVPWYVEERKGEDDWERVKGHPIEILLRKPNQFMSGQDLFERSTQHLNLGGNSLWKYEMMGGVPVEIWALNPDRITPIPSKQNYIEFYEYKVTTGSAPIKIPADEILHFMFTDPANQFWGLAPLQSAAKAVDTDVEAVNWNKLSLQNRAIPDGVFSFEHPLTRDQFLEARSQVAEQHEGKGRNPWVLGAGAKWEQMSLSQADLDFLEGRKFGMYEIHAVFGVDPLVTGAPDFAGRANKKEARLSLWEDTVIPYLDDLKSALNLDLVKFWDADSIRPGVEPRLRIIYDLSNVSALKELIFEKSKTALIFSKIGVPLNMINQRLELGFPEEIPGGDEPLVPKAPAAPPAQAGLPVNPEKKMSDESKTMLWKKVDGDRVRWENRIVSIMSKRFSDEGNKVSRAFARGGQKAAFSAIDKDVKNWEAMLKAIYKAVIDYFGQNRLDEIEDSLKTRKVDFDARTRRQTNKFIAATVATRIKDVTAYTKEVVGTVIKKGIEKDLTNAEIARQIKGRYGLWAKGEADEITASRAMRISRTETGTAAGFGNHTASEVAEEEFGIKMGKVWIDSGDDDVRDTHQNVNGGKAIPLDQDFDNGLAYPLDPSGDPEEIINCRCVEGSEIIRS
jgi:HK97 family phage portal protein